MTVRLKIYGRVQGVFFRRTAKVEADKLGLVGWARNEADGSVGILATGDKAKLKEFIKWCKDGPEMAKVDRIEEDWGDSGRDFESFGIVDK